MNGIVRYGSTSEPVAGVEIHVTGSTVTTPTTNTSGQFGFTGSAGASLYIEPRKTGGDNGAITSLDAAYALQASVGLRSLTPEQIIACDVTANGSVTALDAARILQRVVGIAPTLPVSQSCASDWAFLPDAEPLPNQTVLDPIPESSNCRMGSIALDPLQGDAPNQDFRAVLFGDCTGNWKAQSGASLVRRGLEPSAWLGPPRRAARGEIAQPLFVAGGAFHSLRLTIAYDATRVRSAWARMVDGSGEAILLANIERDELLVVGLARVEPFDPSAGPVLEIVYQLKERSRRAGRTRVVDFSIDE